MADTLVDDFKAAMRQLAATVSLVTTSEEGTRHGMPATAVTSLSLEPPSALVCVNRAASVHGPAERSRFFCLNLLSSDQAALCRQFGARARTERFRTGDWQEGPHGLPYLADAVAALFCRVEETLAYGTHTIFVGRVEQLRVARDRTPLVFQGGAMGRFVPLDGAG